MDYDRAQALIGPFEGRFSHMYLDVNGFCTVGVGNLLPDEHAACALLFVHRDSTAEATDAEIVVAFHRVAAAKKGLRASAYRDLTSIDLRDGDIDRLFRRRVDEFVAQLSKVFPEYGTFPVEAQMAILDMAFNLGSHALATKWPRLSYAIQTRNWIEAAENSHRPQSHDNRNEAIHALFIAAAKVDPQGVDRGLA